MLFYLLLYRDEKIFVVGRFSPSLIKTYKISHVDWWKENAYWNDLSMLAHFLELLLLTWSMDIGIIFPV